MKRWLLLLLLLPCISFAQNVEINPRAENRSIPPDSVVLFPDIDAKFSGGMCELREFVVQNTVFPQCLDCCFPPQGKVYIKMYVEVDGSLSNIEVEKGVNELYDQSALEMVRKMPNWIPAQYHGETVKSMVRLPVTFTFQ